MCVRRTGGAAGSVTHQDLSKLVCDDVHTAEKLEAALPAASRAVRKSMHALQRAAPPTVTGQRAQRRGAALPQVRAAGAGAARTLERGSARTRLTHRSVKKGCGEGDGRWGGAGRALT